MLITTARRIKDRRIGTFAFFDPAKKSEEENASQRTKQEHEFEKDLATVLLVSVSDHFVKVKQILEVERAGK